MKTATLNKAFAEIIATLDDKDLINCYFGGSNLLANYLNDYRTEGISDFIGSWLDDNLNKEWTRDVELTASDVIEDPDCIMQYAGQEFFMALCYVLPNAEPEDVERVFKNSHKFFNSYGDFYVFADTWSNACTDWYIIRASNYEEAFSDLITRFEGSFIVADEDHSEEDLINDNGNHVNTDILQFIGCIKTSE